MKVSGRAVPTAASRLPTAASAMDSRWPAHSTPLVNSSDPTRIMPKLRVRISRWIVKTSILGVKKCYATSLFQYCQGFFLQTLAAAKPPGDGYTMKDETGTDPGNSPGVRINLGHRRRD